MPFWCMSCKTIVKPNTPCTGRWHQQRKSKHMGVIEVPTNKLTKKHMDTIYRKFSDLATYTRCYGYGVMRPPYGLNSESDLFWN